MAPRLVATVGLHGSASTCVFNVVRELMIATVGEGQVVAVFADAVSEFPPPLPADRRHLVLKTHQGSPSWHWLMSLTGAPVLLSVRDPRDSVVSMVDRFGVTLEVAVRSVAADCHLAGLCADGGAHVLRFEDRFYDDEHFAGRVAAMLGLPVGPAECLAIARRYSMQSTRAFTEAMDELPRERVYRDGRVYLDQVTQIHRTHIGDARSGKWRERFPSAEAQALTRHFAGFLERFSYPP